MRLHGDKLDSNPDSDHLSHVDYDPDFESSFGARNAGKGSTIIDTFKGKERACNSFNGEIKSVTIFSNTKLREIF